MESFKTKIYIYFNIKNDTEILKDSFIDDTDVLRKLLYSIFTALKGDIKSTPDFDTHVNVSIEDSCILLSLSGNNISKFRASILSFLRLIDVAYSAIDTSK